MPNVLSSKRARKALPHIIAAIVVLASMPLYGNAWQIIQMNVDTMTLDQWGILLVCLVAASIVIWYLIKLWVFIDEAYERWANAGK